MPRDDGSKAAFDRLRHTHRRIEERLHELEAAASAVVKTADPAAHEACEDVVGFFGRAVARHEADEEETLFPRITHVPELAGLCRRIVADHEMQKALVARLGEALAPGVAPGKLADAVADLCSAYRRHIDLEERELFPAAERVLDAATLERMALEMDNRRGGGAGRGGRA